MDQQLAPFSCTYTPNLPGLLQKLNCSLAISTYQAGKVIFISATDQNQLVQLPRTFERAMGLAVDGHRMAVASKDKIVVLVNAPGLAAAYPRRPGYYDGLFMPRGVYYTGLVDIHDLQWGKEGLWAVNTSFSCLARISMDYSWTPKWKPPFISRLASEDRCHLNGMAIRKGKPAYVTALGAGNTRESWRKTLPEGGVLIEVESGKIILDKLAMPHSPRIFEGRLYALLSARGEVIKVNVQKKTYKTVARLPGFARGMAKYGSYLFVGLSQIRESASFLKEQFITKNAKQAGIAIVHLPSGKLAGELRYQASVEEIYDVQVLPDLKRPGILNAKTSMHSLGLSIPQATFWAKDQDLL